jgi:peptide deformylase
MFYSRITQEEEDTMKKLGYIVAAIVAVGLAAPSIASAETVVIRHGDRDYDRGARAEYREHRDHGWRHHDRVVIIKHRHHHDEY